jgi:hypothetical protein
VEKIVATSRPGNNCHQTATTSGVLDTAVEATRHVNSLTANIAARRTLAPLISNYFNSNFVRNIRNFVNILVGFEEQTT